MILDFNRKRPDSSMTMNTIEIGCALICAGALAACASTSTSTSALADGPAEAVQRIYTLPNPDFSAFHDRERRGRHFTPRVTGLITRAEACFQRTFGMRVLDFDYIVPGQDYLLTNLRISNGIARDGGASVVVRFDNFGEPVELTYLLRRIRGRWLIDEIETADDAEGTLSGALSNACSGNSGAVPAEAG